MKRNWTIFRSPSLRSAVLAIANISGELSWLCLTSKDFSVLGLIAKHGQEDDIPNEGFKTENTNCSSTHLRIHYNKLH